MDFAVKALILGLSTGMFCLGYCMPVVLPLFFGKQNLPGNTVNYMLVRFLSGRMAAYLIFGAAAGFAGREINQLIFRRISAGAMIVLAVLLIFNSVSQQKRGKKSCPAGKHTKKQEKMPFIMGMLTGLNVCPPFLLAASYVFRMGEVIKGMIFFSVFFVATSVYMLPLLFGRRLSGYAQIRWIANLTGVVSGIIFLFTGVTSFLYL